jgi:rhomboid protease GluP
MARCAYCECDLPGLERVCRSCFDEHYFTNKRPKGTPGQSFARLLRLAPLTCSLIGVNFLIFLLLLPEWKSIFGPSEATLIRWGADYGPLTMNGQYWRLLTAMFVHFDLGHGFFNMLALLSLGLLTERAFGKVAFLLGYFGAGLCGSLASQFFHPNEVCMGASGAIFGLVGLLIAPLAMHRLSISPKLLTRPLRDVTLFAAYNIIYGAIYPQINNAAHAGSFLFGIVMGAVFSFRPNSLAAAFVPSLSRPEPGDLVQRGG